MSRSFTITYVFDVSGKINRKITGGRYLSSTPSSAAKKAGQKICQISNVKGLCSFILYLKETTQGSAKKIYKYRIKRVKCNKSVIRDGVEINYHHQFIVKSINDYPDIIRGITKSKPKSKCKYKTK